MTFLPEGIHNDEVLEVSSKLVIGFVPEAHFGSVFLTPVTAKQTNGKLNGLVACELSVRTYGHSQWWVLLQRSGADLCHSSAVGRSDSSDGEQLALL